MRRCVECGHESLVAVTENQTVEVGGRLFVASVPALKCGACDEAYFESKDIQKLELAAALSLVRAGSFSGATFKFLRKLLGLRAADLGMLLKIAPETISRWENGKQPVDLHSLALVGGLIEDLARGSTETRDRLAALSEERAELPALVHLDLIDASSAKGDLFFEQSMDATKEREPAVSNVEYLQIPRVAEHRSLRLAEVIPLVRKAGGAA